MTKSGRGASTRLHEMAAVASSVAFIVFVAAAAASAGGGKREVTYSRDVAPIFYKYCTECHRPNDIAPMALMSYKDARPWARSIKEKVVTREMPPWSPDPRYGEFTNDRRMSAAEIGTVAAWVDQGAKEGDPKDMPPPPDSVDGWRIGSPDRVFAMAEDYTIRPDAPDQYIHYTIPTGFREDRWVQAAEIRPGNRKLVHHVIAHVFAPQTIARANGKGGARRSNDEDGSQVFYKEGSLARIRPEAVVIDDGASAANGGAAFRRRPGDEGDALFSMLLASYAPGKGPDVYDRGMAKRIPAGSVIVLQIHYSSFRGAMAGPQTDRTSVGLVFCKEAPARRVVTLTVPNHFFKIPPGAPNHEVTAGYTFDQEVQLINYMPHMHLRGKDMRYEVIYPDGRRETLLWVPRFNFNWQTVYCLKRPLTIPAGSRLIVTAHFDNSEKNRYNPDPTRAVRWGDPTYDEMMIGWLDYALPVKSSPVAGKPGSR